MSSKNNLAKLQRKLGNRHYKPMFIIVSEGTKTEPEYFELFRKLQEKIIVKCPRGNHKASPLNILKKMNQCLKDEPLRKIDEAWIVVDKDNWKNEDIQSLDAWSQKKENYQLALSNPNFEFWLLLHFEDGNKITSAKDCCERLMKHLPHYNKGIDSRKFNIDMIHTAIKRAKNREVSVEKEWLQPIGFTSVHKLAAKLIS